MRREFAVRLQVDRTPHIVREATQAPLWVIDSVPGDARAVGGPETSQPAGCELEG